MYLIEESEEMNSNNKKRIQALIVILIAVITLGIGYASISAINLFINGNATATVDQNNFDVHFVSTSDTPSLTGNVTLTGSASISQQDSKVALFDVGGLTKVGDYAIATYTIINNSGGIGAELSLDLTNSNPEYFKVTETVTDNILQAGDTTTGTIKVEMIKTPIDTNVTTSITGTLTATPMEDAQASGGDEKEEVRPIPYTYTHHIYDDTYVTLGQPFAAGERTFSNFPAAKEDFGHPVVLAHRVSSNNVVESYVVFEKDNKVYYLRGGAGDEFGQQSMPIYDANVAVLKEAFGENWSSYCSESVGYNYRYFSCSDGSWNAIADANGSVYAGGGGGHCYVLGDGRAFCHG